MPRRPEESAGPKPRLIDGQNRVALPAEVMAALNVKSGDYIAFEVAGSEIKLHRVRWALDRK